MVRGGCAVVVAAMAFSAEVKAGTGGLLLTLSVVPPSSSSCCGREPNLLRLETCCAAPIVVREPHGNGWEFV
jgi:hypothetical protein